VQKQTILKPWLDDKKWADNFNAEIKRICGETFITPALPDDDYSKATDLYIYQLAPVRIGCRVRHYTHFKNYNGQFTIRNTRPNGNGDSEFAKILSGWGDYLFYGFSNENENGFASWMIGDLYVFRYEIFKSMSSKPSEIKYETRSNGDGSSNFIAFYASSFPADFIVSEYNFIPDKNSP